MLLFIGKLILLYLLLAGALYLLARFVHTFLYTEIPPGLEWRAPAAAGAIWLLALAWPLLLNQGIDSKWPVSFNDLFLFSSGENALEFKEFKVAQLGGREVTYVRRKNARGLIEYLNAENMPLPTSEPVIQGVDMEGNTHRFELVKEEKGLIDRPPRQRYHSDTGLVMEGETFGSIATRGYGQFFLSVFGGLITLGAWFAALWLLLLVQWHHALGLAIPLTLAWAFSVGLLL